MLHDLSLSTWPLVGRAADLERLARLRAEHLPGVVVRGPAGVGKSRLTREALRAAASEGALTEWIQATRSAAAVPLGAMAGLLGDVRADDPLDLLRSGVATVRDRAAGRPVVLGVDDAHLLDPISASLVLHLMTSGAAFVVTTVRDGEPCPDAIESLWKDAGAPRMELGTFDEHDTLRLVEAALDGAVDETTRRWVYDRSRGNVLYVRELLLGAVADGALAQRDGLWQLTRPPTPSRPLVDLVQQRLAGLGTDARRAVELLALGEPLLLGEVLRLTDAASLAGAEEADIAVVSVRGGATEVHLQHPLYGEVMRSLTPVARAHQHRVRLAAVVQGREPRTSDDALRIARWLLDADEPLPVRALLEGAEAANLSGDPELAARLATMALDAGAGLAATLLLARSRIVGKRHEETETLLAAAEPDARAASPAQAGAYLELRTLTLYWGLKRPGPALELLERAGGWHPGDDWRRQVDALHLHVLAFTDGFEHTVAVAAELLADPLLDAQLRRRLEPMHAGHLLYSGRGRAAAELAQRIRPAVPLRDQTDDLALTVAGLVGVQTGVDWPGLEEYLTRVVADGVRVGDHAAAGTAALVLGGLALEAGSYRTANRWLAEAALHLEHQDAFGLMLVVHALSAGVASDLGDRERTQAAAARCEDILDAVPLLPSLRPYVRQAQAWATREADPVGARRILLGAVDELADIPIFAAQLAHEALRFGARPRDVADRLRELAARCDAPLVTLYLDHAEARVAGDGAALLACADGFSGLGAKRAACECAAQAASVFVEEGRADSARRAAALSRSLHDPSEGGTPPPTGGFDGADAQLTSRERQLAGLAAAGLTNAEIAERLVLSVRTVESHVYHAMQKLGVSDRRDLRAHRIDVTEGARFDVR